MRWQIITGEYPPQLGGISDYTRQVAQGLVAAGDRVDIWTTPSGVGEPDPADPGINVHRLPGPFGARARAAMDAAFEALPPGERRVLVQYEPWSFGWRSMNVPFCLWLWRRGRRWDLTVMFHEVCADWGWGVRLKENVFGAVNRLTAGMVVRGARRVFVAVPAWIPLLRPWVGAAKPIVCLPIVSNVPADPDAATVATLRAELLARAGVGSGGRLVGHFGTFLGLVASALHETLPLLLRSGAGVVLVGRGAAGFREALGRRLAPDAAARVLAAESLPLAAVAEHLAACDVLLQPYPDGVSARRGSTMAGLNLGAAVVTNLGELSEPYWKNCGAARLVESSDPAALAEAVADLLTNGPERARLRAAAAKFYREHFSVEQVVAALRDDPARPAQARSA